MIRALRSWSRPFRLVGLLPFNLHLFVLGVLFFSLFLFFFRFVFLYGLGVTIIILARTHEYAGTFSTPVAYFAAVSLPLASHFRSLSGNVSLFFVRVLTRLSDT